MPGPPLPRPVLPRERGYMDRMVEYLVGDGPSNRYALICRQCQSHNGMALREEFEYVAYRCCYCYYWNPARKQRPVAPRLMASPSSRRDSSSESSEGANYTALFWGSQVYVLSFFLVKSSNPCLLLGETKQRPIEKSPSKEAPALGSEGTKLKPPESGAPKKAGLSESESEKEKSGEDGNETDSKVEEEDSLEEGEIRDDSVEDPAEGESEETEKTKEEKIEEEELVVVKEAEAGRETPEDKGRDHNEKLDDEGDKDKTEIEDQKRSSEE